jgi:hypothetical protein
VSLVDPNRIALVQSEHAQQTALFCWSSLPETRAVYPELSLMFAVPNGGERSARVAANLKAEGVKAGVLDICLPVARGPWHGLFLEMKWGSNKPTVEQLWFASELAKQNYYTRVAYSFQAGKEELIKYLNL